MAYNIIFYFSDQQRLDTCGCFGQPLDITPNLDRLAREGVAVVVLSSEAQEIIRVCDRALVLYHGDIQAEVKGETMNEHEMMRLATGG